MMLWKFGSLFIELLAVYSATYIVANTTQLLCVRNEVAPDVPKFAATSATNISKRVCSRTIHAVFSLFLKPRHFLNFPVMSMLKDQAFAKIYAAHGKPTTPFPKLSLVTNSCWLSICSSFLKQEIVSQGLFAVRDAATVAASFTLPPRITPWVEAQTGLPHNLARGLVQLVTPLAAQIFTVPFHLTALDLYNNPINPNRAAFVKREYTKTLLARWGRILPAFGIGGVINLQAQDFLNGLMGRKV